MELELAAVEQYHWPDEYGQAIASRLDNLGNALNGGRLRHMAAYLAFLRHAAFGTGLLDLGYYVQVIWNIANGRWFATSLKPPTFLADHFSPALAGLAPLFWAAPGARTLLAIQVLALATAVLPEVLEPGAIITHAQITDVYLVGLAVHQKGKLATLDRRIPADAVRGGRDALELIRE